MRIHNLLLFALLVVSHLAYAQKLEYSSLLIRDSAKHNSNAVIRSSVSNIAIISQQKMLIKESLVVTVLNDKGLERVIPQQYYDKRTTVKNIEATIYDAFGNEIKRIKRKDFIDQSAVDGFSVYSDNRIISLSYTPTQYPFTIVYECEIETSNTAFIPQWRPLEDYYVSVEKAELHITYPNGLGFKSKEYNFDGYHFTKLGDTETALSYRIENLNALKEEDYSPSFSTFLPRVEFGLEHFSLEGIDGNAKTWKEFGQWYSEKILTGTMVLSDDVKNKIRILVGDEDDPIKKAKIVYDFVQQKSRYVSIQMGIGGWKPMIAADVDRLGYGDCKALSNYTKALLETVGVPSFHTILYGSKGKSNIQRDFVSMQGNHMILSIPHGNDYFWLECTSQTDPFGYQGIFTDDRDVLLIKPEGGVIAHTKIYADKSNTQISKGKYSIAENGDFTGSISIVSEGTQYADKPMLLAMLQLERDNHFKKYWSNINNLKIVNSAFTNDRDKVSFAENIELAASNYGTFSGARLMFALNAFNNHVPQVRKIRNRKLPFQIQRGFFDDDEIEIAVPSGYQVEAIPSSFEVKNKFGEYKSEITPSGESFVYRRTFLIKSGKYTKAEYEEFRQFIVQVERADNSKLILIKS